MHCRLSKQALHAVMLAGNQAAFTSVIVHAEQPVYDMTGCRAANGDCSAHIVLGAGP